MNVSRVESVKRLAAVALASLVAVAGTAAFGQGLVMDLAVCFW